MKKYKNNMKKYAFITLLMTLALMYACTTSPTGDVITQTPPAQQPIVEPPTSSQSVPKITGISLVTIPELAKTNDSVNIGWSVDSTENIMADSTRVYYDVVSHQDGFNTDMTPSKANYLFATMDSSKILDMPNQFMTNLKVPDSAKTIYLRAYATIDGKNYWSGEKSFDAVPAVFVTSSGSDAVAKKFIIDLTSAGMNKENILVNQGDKVVITFTAGRSGIPSEGYEVKSQIWGTTGPIYAGQSKVVEFVASQTAFYQLYRTDSNNALDSGEIYTAS